MSDYTTQVRYICENYCGLESSEGYDKVEEIIDNSIGKIFDFNFPIFDENYRYVLERKIIRHFYTREIGLETVGLWKLKLATKLNEIMPYYNQLYKSCDLIVEPLLDVDFTRLHSGEFDENTDNKTGTTSGGTTSDNSVTNTRENITDYNMFSDTPQGGLQGVETGEYITSANKNVNNAENSKEDTTIRKYTNTIDVGEKGKRGGTDASTDKIRGNMGARSKSALLLEYRKTMINIDMMVIRDLEELFITLW